MSCSDIAWAREYAFFNRLRFDEKETFHHFGFTHTPEEEQAATQKGIELLKKSPYQDQLGNAQLFLQALNGRSKEIPNLVSPHVGNGVATALTTRIHGARRASVGSKASGQHDRCAAARRTDQGRAMEQPAADAEVQGSGDDGRRRGDAVRADSVHAVFNA